MRQSYDIVIVGGGLAGLTAATLLARAGRSVRLLERGTTMGGRASTVTEKDYVLHQGFHGFYLGGPAEAILRDLGIVLTGGKPVVAGAAEYRGRITHLPISPMNAMVSPILTVPARSELVRVLTSLPGIDPVPLYGETVRTWVERAVWQSESRLTLYALFRVATHINAPETLSAGVAISQAQRLLKVTQAYLDDGWGSLVESLRITASVAGAHLATDRSVARVAREGAHWVVDWGPETEIEAGTVILAVPPQAAASMVEEPAGRPLSRWSREAQPVVAASLELGLAIKPKPRYGLLWGLDQPYFMTDLAAYSRAVAPPWLPMMEIIYCLHPTSIETGSGIEGKIEQMLDRAQPGWREAVEVRRYIPRLTVMHSLPRAHPDGLSARPGPAVPDNPGLYVVGDWVGPVGLLSEASIASAAQAAELILERG